MPLEAVDDDYVQKIVKQGDEVSDLMKSISARTWKNSMHIKLFNDGEDKRAAVSVPEGYNAVVCSDVGIYSRNPEGAASLLVSRLAGRMREIGATPVAILDTIDAGSGDKNIVRRIEAPFLNATANEHLGILGGEFAVLGGRVNGEATFCGAVIGVIPKKTLSGMGVRGGAFYRNGIWYSTFDAKGRPVIANSDGAATKLEFYERTKQYGTGNDDLIAMIFDDAAKNRGVEIKAATAVLEMNGFGGAREEVRDRVRNAFERRCRQMNVIGIMQDFVTDGIQSYKPGVPAYNLNGTAVSVIEESGLSYPLRPEEGDIVIGIRGNKPGPRDNGISAKRRGMTKLLGEEWHTTEEGKNFMEFLSQPSIIFYPIFREMIEKKLASSVYHMSGGAYDGKFAKPVARTGLVAVLDELFFPDAREVRLLDVNNTGIEDAYGQCPVGNEGFVTTKNPKEAIDFIKRKGLDAEVVGSMKRVRGMTGVLLTAYNGELVYFSGK